MMIAVSLPQVTLLFGKFLGLHLLFFLLILFVIDGKTRLSVRVALGSCSRCPSRGPDVNVDNIPSPSYECT